MPPKPKIVVAFDSQLKQFVERHIAVHIACADLRQDFVVVALGFRKPVRLQRSARSAERAQIAGKLPPDAGFC